MDLTKARLVWVEFYAKTGDAGLVCRCCGISRPTLRKWWRRYQADGEAGLVEHSRRSTLCSCRSIGPSVQLQSQVWGGEGILSSL